MICFAWKKVEESRQVAGNIVTCGSRTLDSSTQVGHFGFTINALHKGYQENIHYDREMCSLQQALLLHW